MDPNTRYSLILRLGDPNDQDAWDEFSILYRPIIVRFAQYKGLGWMDADDVAQQVMLSISKHISDWVPDSDKCKFRTWFKTIVRNATLNALARRPADEAMGNVKALFEIEASQEADDDSQFDLEWGRQMFRWAADRVRDEVQPETWEAFWLTAVEGLSAAQVAKKMNKSIGAVYVARSRVMQRIQRMTNEFESGQLP